MYSDAFDVNFGQKCCYNGIVVQSCLLTPLLRVKLSRVNYWLVLIRFRNVEFIGGLNVLFTLM